MNRIEITLHIDLPDWYINISDAEEREWLEGLLNRPSDLRLHSNEISNEIGEIIDTINVKMFKL